MITRIVLKGLAVEGIHGVLPVEKQSPQLFLVDVELTLREPPSRDDITQTVDYAELTAQIGSFVLENSFELLETLAANIAKLCREYWRIGRIRVAVHKPQVILEFPVGDVYVEVIDE